MESRLPENDETCVGALMRLVPASRNGLGSGNALGSASLQCSLALLGIFVLATVSQAASPNVVLITIDTVRADRVGCYGYQPARTPNLDALAREGVLFRTVVASVPLTLPSHCSIMTGTYPTVHGVRDNLGYTLGESPPTLATILKQRGYSTAAFVGADVLDPARGLNRGFDTYSCPLRRKMGRDNPIVFNLVELQRRAEDVVADALGWLSAQPNPATKPFFAWIHLYDPHLPYDPPARFRALLRDPYDGEIAYADYALGKVFQFLRDHHVYNSTLIVVASDHGESFGEHGEYAHGYFIYDTTLLVPFIVKPPSDAGIAAHRCETPVRTIDIAPTVLQFLEIAPPPSMQGVGLRSLLLGKTAGSTTGATYCETFYPNEFGWSALRALRSEQYKYIEAPKPELYDLARDPQENHNLYQTKPAVALDLKAKLNNLLTRITPKEPLRRSALSPSDLQALASLGYVATSTPIASGTPGNPLPDPKDELQTYKTLSSATQMAAEGKCDRALPLLTRLAHEQPGVYLGQLTLAKCELASGNYSAAESALDSAIHASPGQLDAVFYKGICLFQENRFKEALPRLQLVERALPDEPYVHFYLGSIYEREGAAGPALEEFQKCATLDPNFEVAVYKVGYLLAKGGKFREAIVAFRKVAEMDPGNASAHFNLALAYVKSGNESAARPEFETACKLDASKCLPRGQQ